MRHHHPPTAIASLKIEAIGDNTESLVNDGARMLDSAAPGMGEYFRIPRRHWVAEITGRDEKYGYAREFLRGNKDYSEANSVGSRGVFVYYLLKSGRVYEVKSPVSWKNSDRYFCRVSEDGCITRMSRDEVDEWVNGI